MATTLLDLLNSLPEEPCEICKEYFPYIRLAHVSGTDRRLVCLACALTAIDDKSKLLFGLVPK